MNQDKDQNGFFFFTILKWSLGKRKKSGIDSLRHEVHDFVKWGGILLLKAEHIMILLRVKKCPWSSIAHFPEEILRGLAASTTPLFLPIPCTPLLSLQSVEERWAGTYPRPGCWLHPPECRPEGSPGRWAGLHKVRVWSWFWPLRMAFKERRVLTDLFTPQLMGKNKREEGSVEMEDFGSAMCNV